MNQNHSLRYATHQLIIPIGIVASSDHKIGIVKSAISPSTMNVPQKTLRSIPSFYRAQLLFHLQLQCQFREQTHR